MLGIFAVGYAVAGILAVGGYTDTVARETNWPEWKAALVLFLFWPVFAIVGGDGWDGA